MKELSVIIPTCNNLLRTEACVSLLRSFGREEIKEIIIVDNNSSDGTNDWLQVQKDIKVIMNEENRGLAVAYNQGARIATGNFLLFMHNDVYITPDVLSDLLEVMRKNPHIGVSGVYTNRCRYYMQIIKNSSDQYEDLEGLVKYAQQVVPRLYPCIMMVLESFFMLTRREAYEKVGGFDEDYFLPGCEDFDFTLRIQQERYNVYLGAGYVHHDNNSFAMNHANVNEVYAHNAHIFKQKWETDPTYSILVRSEILQHINMQKIGLTVLDVGCSGGGNLMHIKQHNATAQLYGIELNAHMAKVAANYGDVYAEDLEKLDRPEWQDKFDYIICGDILEHLYNPWKVVKNLAELLKTGGKVIVSVPNINYAGIIFNMLQGNWRYENAGILDRTHLRFFTRATAIEMLQNAGLQVIELSSTNINTTEIVEKFVDNLLRLPECNCSKEELDAYQWIIVAQKV